MDEDIDAIATMLFCVPSELTLDILRPRDMSCDGALGVGRLLSEGSKGEGIGL